MCVINISLNPTTPAGTTITNRNGRYRKVGTTTWTNFTITSNSYALNVNDLGQYELQVNVTNSLGVVSSWASSTFSVTTDCGVTALPTTTYQYTGIYTFPDPVHSQGGVVTYIDAAGVTQIRSGIWDTDCVSIVASSIVTKTGVIVGCESAAPATTGTTTTTVTNSGVFSNGTTVNHGHALPAADPDSSQITGTLTVTGTKTYNVSIKNQYNVGNIGTGYLQIVRNGGTTVGTVTVQTNGTYGTITSTGGITVTAGTYTYTLRATLDIVPSATGGAVTATIV